MVARMASVGRAATRAPIWQTSWCEGHNRAQEVTCWMVFENSQTKGQEGCKHRTLMWNFASVADPRCKE